MMIRNILAHSAVIGLLATVAGLVPAQQSAGDQPTVPTAERKDELGERYYIWKEDQNPDVFTPAGWMPDGTGLSQSTSETDTPHSGEHCLRVQVETSTKPWVGVYFLHGGTFEPDESVNLYTELDAKPSDVIRCRFWARSAEGAVVQFKVGGITKGKVKDSIALPVATNWLKLEKGWNMYEIDVTKKDLKSMVGAFMWVCDKVHNKGRDVSFDIDDVYFVKLAPPNRVR